MQYYTVDDLQQRLDTRPCSTDKGWVDYTKNWLIELIKKDYRGDKVFNKQQIWNVKNPQVWGITIDPEKTVTYPKKVETYAKTRKSWNGGRYMIIMNESYYDNCYYIIEKKYWDRKLNPYKRDTRKEIINTISNAVISSDEKELSNKIEQLLLSFLSRINKNIVGFNDFFATKRSQLYFYLTFYTSTYVLKNIDKPAGLLCLIKMQIDTLEDEIKLLFISPKDLHNYINGVIEVLSEKYSDNEMKIKYIADRIYSYEQHFIDQFREKRKQFDDIADETYNLERDIKIKTAELIKSNKRLLPNSLIIEHAKSNGLIGASFNPFE